MTLGHNNYTTEPEKILSLRMQEAYGPTTAHGDRDIDQTPVVTESANIQSKPLAMLLDTTSLTLNLCYSRQTGFSCYIKLWFEWEKETL